ncbi:MAG: PIG-L deacetylase family protein, partial [Anaerolineae bacterium]
MRIIYLSPHLDDAVLSAGGLIHSQAGSGIPVEVWTCMAGAPPGPDVPEFAQVMHRIWGFSDAADAVRSRRAEYLRAVESLGARAHHFDFLDCIYRRGTNGEALYSDITLPIQPDDAQLPTAIADQVGSLLRPDDQLVCQLAIGGHVDHVIVRRAAESLRRPLIYLADIPYVLDHPDELRPAVIGLTQE